MKICYYLIILFIISLYTNLDADIYHVGLEAQYDYHTIQSAVDECSNGDTVLVHPGTYTQTFTISNKAISLLSMFALSGNHADIDNTIISGNNQEYYILFAQSEMHSILQGFTIRDFTVNGFVLMIDNYTNVDLRDCIITNNFISNDNCATIGVGYMAEAWFSGCKIYHNYATQIAGIHKNVYGTIHFDPVHRNSIYSNYGGLFSDIFYDYAPNELTTEPLDTLYLDIGTSNFADPLCYWGINNVVVNQVSESKVTNDLYVAPWGNNANSGLNSQSPLRTIYQATRLACPNTGDSLVINIASGTYSFNNYDDLRLGVRPGVILKGDATDFPVLDGQHIWSIIYNAGNGLLKLENLKVQNGDFYTICYNPYFLSPNEVGDNVFQGRVEITNVEFYHNYIDLAVFSCQNVHLKNVISINVPNSVSQSSIQLLHCQNTKIENSIFMSKHGTTSAQSNAVGYSISLGDNFSLPYLQKMDIINCIIAQNHSNSNFVSYLTEGISMHGNVTANLINSIIVDNNSDVTRGAAIYLNDGATCNLYNSVIWNNRPYNILMLTPDCQLTAQNSLIENAAQSYLYPSWILPDGNVVYDDTNLGADAVPTFVGNGHHRYMPISSSAVIDAGSLDYPEGVSIPQTDLAGNPRVYGSAIDLGPYEWQGTEFDFTYLQNNEQVTFIQSSNQQINDIHWDFDMDGNIDSEELIPTYTYTANGTYSVGCYINQGQGGITKLHLISVTTGTEDQTTENRKISLDNYPNPFNPSTVISCSLKDAATVRLNVYNIRGQLVKTLINERMAAGTHTVVWNGCDDSGQACASGVYFSRLTAGKISLTKKMVLVK